MMTTPLTVFCPVCGVTLVWQETPSRPFCSPQCRERDLAAWASGDYVLPAKEETYDDQK